MKRMAKVLIGNLVASALAVGVAGAQVNFTTQGQFTGSAAPGNCTVGVATTVQCAGAGFTLVYAGTAGINLASGTITSLGTFTLTGTGSTTVPAGVLDFTLFVNQTTPPPPGQSAFIGAITGTVSTTTGNFSDLKWSPNGTTAINNVTYQLVFDNVGPSTGAIGIPINNSRGINALITVRSTVPEPATVGLMAVGLVGVLAAARRRRAT